MAAPMFNVFVGSETGLFKGINTVRSYWDNLNAVETIDKDKEICVMNWSDRNEKEICLGLKNRDVVTFLVEQNSFSEKICRFDGGKGRFKGLAKYNDNFISAVESGCVRVWEDGETVTEIDAGENLCCMTQNSCDNAVIATGGKENDLKIWNLTTPDKPTFYAKNVRNDWLNLRVPIWVLGIQFQPNSNKIITCTGHHQVRVYDPSTTQRRPVLDMDFDEHPITAMSLCPQQDNQVVVGNTQGSMALLDLRKGKLVHRYKGFAGGIRSIKCHPTRPLVASCGLDRFLRIHDIQSKQLVHKFYLKSRLNCLLFAEQWPDVDSGEGEKSVTEEGENIDCGMSDESEEEKEGEIWDTMEVVKTKTVKKHKKDIKSTSRELKRPGSRKEDKVKYKKLKKTKTL